MITSRGIWLAGVALVSLEGCAKREAPVGSSASQSGNVPCIATLGTLPAGTHMTAISGEHRLTLVATGGSRAGQSTTGSLRIETPTGLTNIDSLVGKSSIALAAVGATAPGRGDEVVVTEWMLSSSSGSMTPQITVRLGRIPAAPGTSPIEGGHMALSVNTVTETAFSGTWDSETGEPMGPKAYGYFCAVRGK